MHLFLGTSQIIGRRRFLNMRWYFLGTGPAEAPALYSIMSHVDLSLGVIFPEGGMGSSSTGTWQTRSIPWCLNPDRAGGTENYCAGWSGYRR